MIISQRFQFPTEIASGRFRVDSFEQVAYLSGFNGTFVLTGLFGLVWEELI